jgi:hypothetical protein
MAYVRCPYCDAAPRERDFAAHVKDCRRRAEQRVPIKTIHTSETLARALERQQRWYERHRERLKQREANT